MKKSNLKQQVAEAIAACQDKKADEITILELEKGSGAFTDYFVVHVFSEKSRRFYDLERLWKSAKKLEPAELIGPVKRKRAPTRSLARKGA
jgi:ribosomal silencing factor RsfS